MLESGGHKTYMLWRATCRLRQLKAFLASTSRTPWADESENIARSHRMNSCLTSGILPCTKLKRSSSFQNVQLNRVLSTALAIILRTTSPIPIGHTPGHLSRAMRRHTTSASIPSGSAQVASTQTPYNQRQWVTQIIRSLLKWSTKLSPSINIQSRWACRTLSPKGSTSNHCTIQRIKDYRMKIWAPTWQRLQMGAQIFILWSTSVRKCRITSRVYLYWPLLTLIMVNDVRATTDP